MALLRFTLEDYMAEYPLTQINSQKYLGPPTWWEWGEPTRLTEIFISNLHTSVTPYDLLALTFPYGKVYQVRLPVTFTEAKGFAYVRFIRDSYATRAIAELNGKQFMGRKLNVERSMDTRVLQVFNWPRNFTLEQSTLILQRNLIGVIRVNMYPDVEQGLPNTGFVLVEFSSHNNAAVGRRDIKANVLIKLTNTIHPVSWARGDFDIPEDHFIKVTDLYVGNLPAGCQRKNLEEIIKKSLDISEIFIKVHAKGFGFIYFKTHELAEEALVQLKGANITMGGKVLQFHWVKGPYTRRRQGVSESSSGTITPEEQPCQCASDLNNVAIQKTLVKEHKMFPDIGIFEGSGCDGVLSANAWATNFYNCQADSALASGGYPTAGSSSAPPTSAAVHNEMCAMLTQQMVTGQAYVQQAPQMQTARPMRSLAGYALEDIQPTPSTSGLARRLATPQTATAENRQYYSLFGPAPDTASNPANKDSQDSGFA